MAYVFRGAIGTVDGINDTFFHPDGYKAGTLVVFLNGQLIQSEAGDPWEEVDPETGEFRITDPECIPRSGDGLVTKGIPFA